MTTIENIVEQYGAYIYNLAYQFSGQKELADDLAQETFIQAWKHLEQLQKPAALKQWLRTICINQFKMLLRKENRLQTVYTDNLEELERDGQLLVNIPASIVDEVQSTEDVACMRNGCFLAMSRKLTINQRLAFSLIDMFGQSIQEVADLLDITPKAAKGLLYRARMNLDSFFQDHCYFLNTENPCRCTAWIEFFRTRDKLQQTMQETILDYKAKGYTFDAQVRQKVAYYYQHIPEQTPDAAWYETVIAQFSHS